MTTYDWPAALTRFRAIAFNPRGMTVSGPPSLLGRTQVGSLDAGYWVAGVFAIAANRPERVRAFRALRASLEGGAHAVRVPACDGANAPTGLTIETVGIQAARSTLVEVDTTTGLEGGEYFSFSDRLYLVREIVESPVSLAIWPPLREEVADSTALDFTSPTCRMRLIDESSGDLTLDFFKWGSPDMAFVEVF